MKEKPINFHFNVLDVCFSIIKNCLLRTEVQLCENTVEG